MRLPDTNVSDAGLVHLRGLTQLTSLSISGTKVTDAGLVYLSGLTNLTTLNLSATKVTDAGLGVPEFQRVDKAYRAGPR